LFVRDVQALPGDQTPPAKAHRRAPEAFAAGSDPAPANGEHGFASLNGSHPELTTFWVHDNRYAHDTFEERVYSWALFRTTIHLMALDCGE